MTVKRMEGETQWSWGDGFSDAKIADAIVTEERIAFDCTEWFDYTVELKPASIAGGWWTGTWRRKSDRKSGTCSAKLIKYEDGEIELEGIWTEDAELRWYTSLTEK